MKIPQLKDWETHPMTTPIDVSPESSVLSSLMEADLSFDDLIEVRVDSELATYQLIAARRAQLGRRRDTSSRPGAFKASQSTLCSN